jgi:hypothetical protein
MGVEEKGDMVGGGDEPSYRLVWLGVMKVMVMNCKQSRRGRRHTLVMIRKARLGQTAN